MSSTDPSSSSAQPQPQPQLPPLPAFFDWEAFRREGHKVVDFIADYHAQLQRRELPVHATAATAAGFLPAAMGLGSAEPPLPQSPQPFDQTLGEFKAGVVPGMLHWQHPDFFGYFPAQLGPSAMLGEMLGAAMNTPGFSWAAAPSASEMENLVMRWLVELFHLPKEHFSFEGTGGAVLQPSATEAAIVAILAAKNKKLAGLATVEERMAVAGRLVVYVSDQAHFCIEKAAKVIGIPYFRKIESDETNAFFAGNRTMNIDKLKAAVEADIAAGLVPCFVSVNFGATGICAIDDIQRASDEVAKPFNIWLNIDGAYAGVVAMLPEFAEMTKPFAAADSIFINASKWMATMFNATMFFFKERAPIVSSLNATGVYLDNDFTSSGAVVDYKDYQLGLGRPFRSIKLYTTLKSLGAEGLAAGIRRHIILAKYLFEGLQKRSAEAEKASKEEGGAPFPFPLAFPIEPLFGLVCFTLRGASEPQAMAVLRRLNATNKLFMVHTVLDGAVVFRVALSYPSLEAADMDRLMDTLFEVLSSAEGTA